MRLKREPLPGRGSKKKVVVSDADEPAVLETLDLSGRRAFRSRERDV